MRTALQVSGGLLLALLAHHTALQLSSSRATPSLAPPSTAPPSTAPPPSSSPAPALSAPPDPLPEHAAPVASYTLRARLEPLAHLVRGEGTLTWRNTSRDPQPALYVHLYLNAFKSRHTLFQRTPIEGFRGTPHPSEHGWIDVTRFAIRDMDARDVWPSPQPTTPDDPHDQTDIRVPLPRPVAPGEQITIDLAWDAHLPPIVARTGHLGTFHMVAQWFPKIARLDPDGRWRHFPFHPLSEFHADFGTYDVTLDVPAAYLVGATGQLTTETRAPDRVVRRYLQHDVHDFAFAAWDHFQERTATTPDGIALRCLYPPGQDHAAALQLDLATFGLAHFGQAFGRYPYATLTLVHPPPGAEEAGGMEYPTLITTGGTWDTLFVGERGLASLTLHEVAHQWFYGLLATDEHRHPFLDEGLTTWAETDALHARYGAGSQLSLLGLDVDVTATHRIAALYAGPDGPLDQPTPAFMSGAEYGNQVYSRASTLLATLGRVYGDDHLRAALGHYARAHRFAHPTPDDLLASVRRTLGDTAAEALHAGLRGARVDYAVTEIQPDAPDPLPATAPSPPAASPPDPPAYRALVLVRRRGDLVLPVDIDLYAADGTIQRVRWDARERAARIPYAGNAPLVAAIVDPDFRVLLDEDLTNNAHHLDPARLAPRVLERATFAAGAALWAIAP
ncbi:M1 family metallopeptidase [Chondromyces apiculatus]|uniref:Peptidase M1 membrane alanine aminopeptidase domain-containing protein n=1 Tax=Chondromyces apiculatus DSM 436 TaxID=1192034 RepID=A0A017SZ85_9BACT|nr:M1 family metallopeptidase [Chondromyces apiculatus]EYF02042.1 Hypothetical protein CAP_7521 [Chondromyces apiculatus DSM 436]